MFLEEAGENGNPRPESDGAGGGGGTSDCRLEGNKLGVTGGGGGTRPYLLPADGVEAGSDV